MVSKDSDQPGHPSAKSDLSLLLSKDLKLVIEGTANTLIRLDGWEGLDDVSRHWCTCYYVSFEVPQLKSSPVSLYKKIIMLYNYVIATKNNSVCPEIQLNYNHNQT